MICLSLHFLAFILLLVCSVSLSTGLCLLINRNFQPVFEKYIFIPTILLFCFLESSAMNPSSFVIVLQMSENPIVFFFPQPIFSLFFRLHNFCCSIFIYLILFSVSSILLNPLMFFKKNLVLLFQVLRLSVGFSLIF